MISKENMAIEAASLLQNEVLSTLLDDIDANARDRLVTIDAEQTGAIRDQQALCRAVDEIRTRLRLTAAPVMNQPSVA